MFDFVQIKTCITVLLQFSRYMYFIKNIIETQIYMHVQMIVELCTQDYVCFAVAKRTTCVHVLQYV